MEFDELVSAHAPRLVDQALLEVFQAFDHGSYGYICAAELARSMARLGSRAAAHLRGTEADDERCQIFFRDLP